MGERYRVVRRMDGSAARVRAPERAKHRVTFSKAEPDPLKTMINQRTVLVDGAVRGWLFGREPAAGNPTRPTSFVFVEATDSRWERPQVYDRLETAREGIGRHYGLVG